MCVSLQGALALDGFGLPIPDGRELARVVADRTVGGCGKNLSVAFVTVRALSSVGG